MANTVALSLEYENGVYEHAKAVAMQNMIEQQTQNNLRIRYTKGPVILVCALALVVAALWYFGVFSLLVALVCEAVCIYSVVSNIRKYLKCKHFDYKAFYEQVRKKAERLIEDEIDEGNKIEEDYYDDVHIDFGETEGFSYARSGEEQTPAYRQVRACYEIDGTVFLVFPQKRSIVIPRELIGEEDYETLLALLRDKLNVPVQIL